MSKEKQYNNKKLNMLVERIFKRIGEQWKINFAEMVFGEIEKHFDEGSCMDYDEYQEIIEKSENKIIDKLIIK